MRATATATLIRVSCRWLDELTCRQCNYLQVDEDGAKASSVSTVNSGLTAPMTWTLRFDRPFAYLLTDSATGTILLYGFVNDVRID